MLGRGGPTAVIRRPEEFYARIGRHQLIGFGEAYLTGAWDTDRPDDLGAFLTVLAAWLPSAGVKQHWPEALPVPAWPWYAPLGAGTTVVAAVLVGRFSRPGTAVA